MSSGSYGAVSERGTLKRRRTTYLIRATMKPIMKGERKGEMMKPIVHKFNCIHDISTLQLNRIQDPPFELEGGTGRGPSR